MAGTARPTQLSFLINRPGCQRMVQPGRVIDVPGWAGYFDAGRWGLLGLGGVASGLGVWVLAASLAWVILPR